MKRTQIGLPNDLRGSKTHNWTSVNVDKDLYFENNLHLIFHEGFWRKMIGWNVECGQLFAYTVCWCIAWINNNNSWVFVETCSKKFLFFRWVHNTRAHTNNKKKEWKPNCFDIMDSLDLQNALETIMTLAHIVPKYWKIFTHQNFVFDAFFFHPYIFGHYDSDAIPYRFVCSTHSFERGTKNRRKKTLKHL